MSQSQRGWWRTGTAGTGGAPGIVMVRPGRLKLVDEKKRGDVCCGIFERMMSGREGIIAEQRVTKG